MKLNVTLCVLLLSLIPSLFGQDHAPTVEQCRADQRLWSSVLDDQHAFKAAVLRLSVQTIQQRSGEMRDCFAVDPENHHDYFVLVAAYGTETGVRYKNFIDRHNLMAKFLAEDVAGER